MVVRYNCQKKDVNEVNLVDFADYMINESSSGFSDPGMIEVFCQDFKDNPNFNSFFYDLYFQTENEDFLLDNLSVYSNAGIVDLFELARQIIEKQGILTFENKKEYFLKAGLQEEQIKKLAPL